MLVQSPKRVASTSLLLRAPVSLSQSPAPPLLLTPEGLRPGELLIIHTPSSLLQWPLNGQQAFYYLPRHQCLSNNRKQCQRAGEVLGGQAERERDREKERDRGIIRWACRLISPPPDAKNGHQALSVIAYFLWSFADSTDEVVKQHGRHMAPG